MGQIPRSTECISSYNDYYYVCAVFQRRTVNEFHKTLLVAAASQAVGSTLDSRLVNDRKSLCRVCGLVEIRSLGE